MDKYNDFDKLSNQNEYYQVSQIYRRQVNLAFYRFYQEKNTLILLHYMESS